MLQKGKGDRLLFPVKNVSFVEKVNCPPFSLFGPGLLVSLENNPVGCFVVKTGFIQSFASQRIVYIRDIYDTSLIIFYPPEIGSSTVKTAPPSARLRAEISPPCSLMIP